MQAKLPEPKLSGGSAQVSSSCFRIDPLFQAPDPARVSGASVTFEPRQTDSRLGDRAQRFP